MKNLIVGFLVLFSSIVNSQNRMTPELLWKLKRVSGIQVSPDGTQVLFSLKSYNLNVNKGENNLYVVPVEGGEIKQITDFPGNELSAQWRPDGKKIGFIMKSEKDQNLAIFEIDLNGENLQQISHTSNQISEFKYFPNGKRILFSADVKMRKVNSREIVSDLPLSNARVIDDLMYRHWSTWDNGIRSHLFIASIENGIMQGDGTDIMKGEDFDAPLKPFGGLEQVTISPDGVEVVYACKKMTGKNYAISTNADLWSYNVLLRNSNNLTKNNKGYDLDPQFSPDGKKLAWLSMEQDGFESDKNDIVIYDYETSLKTNYTNKYDITVSGFTWNDKGDKVYFKSVKEATYQLFELDLKNGKIQQLTTGDHNYTSVDFAGKYLVGGRQSMNHPTDIYTVKIKSGEQTKITDVNKAIYDNLEIGKIEKRWVSTTDDKKELVWVIYPPNFDPNKVYPALLYCQGGPQSAVSQFFSYRWNFQLMAANDYIVIAPNRRGLPGFGQEWNDAISGDWGGQPMDDYLSAVDEIKNEPYIDANRIGAVGASYGGYSVYYLAGIHENRFKCFISHCGLYNLESWYGTTEELFFANKDIGGPYFSPIVPTSYKKFSPHKLAHKWNTPMLIFHGEQDFRVPLNQGLEAFQVLQLKGIDSRMILFPDENHWILSPQNGVYWHREYYKWLDQHLK
ncbi:alpha/beta hydrolase family protein [Crocinitomix algicola]|uniref:alpha/beta hydrolase family protein n=1 Tax=Crocinitomix algicola TaxID=1740263 RepID=UPI0008730650|nr:S9 family peptidase [Crocinitomix algicola]